MTVLETERLKLLLLAFGFGLLMGAIIGASCTAAYCNRRQP